MGSIGESEVMLLDAWPSPYGMRPKIALAEKGIQYECKQEESWPQKSALLLQMNPVHKLIPVLIHDGKPICESNIIMEYIDETWKDKPPLMPSDPLLRAKARFCTDYVDKTIFDSGRKIWFNKGEELEKAVVEFLDHLKVLEGLLGDNPYFVGESFGCADIALVPFYCFFYTYETLGNFKIKKECPKLVAWGKRCMERESVSKTLVDPHKIYEIVTKFIKGVFVGVI